MKRLVYHLEIDENKEKNGMKLISLVRNPAMRVQAVKLSEVIKPVHLQVNEYKQYLTSAVIIPNKLIPRLDEDGNEYDVMFTAESAELIAVDFMKQGTLNLSNKDHKSTDTLDTQLIEFWIIKDPALDKAVALGFEGLPAGTVMATIKVNDKEVWEKEVLSGNVTGFSLEGLFAHIEVNLKEVDNILELSETETPKYIWKEILELLETE